MVQIVQLQTFPQNSGASFSKRIYLKELTENTLGTANSVRIGNI